MTTTPSGNFLATFAIIAYNQEAFIEEAVVAALGQTYAPLEILISDVASTDRTAEVIRRVVAGYTGPHSVVVNINKANLGIGEHVNQVFGMARGRVVVLAGGDDVSCPARTSRVMERWVARDPHPSAIYCGARKISAAGAGMGRLITEMTKGPRQAEHVILFKHLKRMLAIGACGAYDTRLMETFGLLDPDLSIEDIPMIARASMANGLEYIDEDLVDYRTNVSVWRLRKLPGDSFQKRIQRRRFYTEARLKVARQVLSDAIKTRNPSFIGPATRAYLLHEFVFHACVRQHFSLRDYLVVGLTTKNWAYPWVAAALDGHPRIHAFLFWVKHALVLPLTPARHR